MCPKKVSAAAGRKKAGSKADRSRTAASEGSDQRPAEREAAETKKSAPKTVRQKAGGGEYMMISEVAERFEIHPQTLRLYEREGLLTPHRSPGNTRLYDGLTITRLETILVLTRDLGVNLAGVEVILSLREQREELQIEVDRLLRYVQQEIVDRRVGVDRRHALVKLESGLPAKI